jgi:hypothetical protein
MEDIRYYRIEEDRKSARNDEEATLRLMREVDAASKEEEVPFHVPRD